MDPLDELQPGAKYCCDCGYVLAGLSEDRCPECGRRFDPQDPRTYRSEQREANHPGIVILVNLIPLMLASILFVWWVPKRGFMGTNSIEGLAYLVSLQGCGPVALLTYPLGRLNILIFLALWGTWLFLMTRRRARELPLIVHVLLPLGWCFIGCSWMAFMIALAA